MIYRQVGIEIFFYCCYGCWYFVCLWLCLFYRGSQPPLESISTGLNPRHLQLPPATKERTTNSSNEPLFEPAGGEHLAPFLNYSVSAQTGELPKWRHFSLHALEIDWTDSENNRWTACVSLTCHPGPYCALTCTFPYCLQEQIRDT